MEIVIILAFALVFLGTVFAMPAILGVVGLANMTGLMVIAFAVLGLMTRKCRSLADLDRVLSEEDEGPIVLFLTTFLVGSGIGLLRPNVGLVWSVILAALGLCVVIAAWIDAREAVRRSNEAAAREAKEESSRAA